MRKNVISKEAEDSSFSELENQRLKLKFNQLMVERISKIVKMADTKTVSTRKKGNMTASEQILFKRIVDLVQFWKNEFIDK